MGNKKVLFAGIEAPTYSSTGMIEGFEKSGFDVVYFDWQKVRFNCGTEGMRDRLVTKAYIEQPDLIFLQIQNPDAIDETTAVELQNIAFTVNYTFDTREDISWYKKIAPKIGLTLFGSYDEVEECYKEGIMNVDYLQSSYNHLWYKPQLKTNKYYGDIIFLGSNYLNTNLNYPKAQHRYDMVQFMKKEFGDRFHVYGRGWGADEKMLNPQESIEAMCNAKIVITQNNFNRRGYQSDRTWNALGCHSFVIAEYYEGIEQDFNGTEDVVFVWRTFEELKDKCKNILNDDCTLIRYMYSSRLRVEQRFQWKNRIETLKKLISKYETKRISSAENSNTDAN